jgi:hypothetical protein
MFGKEKHSLGALHYFGAFFVLWSVSALLHFFIEPADWEIALKTGKGGGHLGWTLASIAMNLVGFATAGAALGGTSGIACFRPPATNTSAAAASWAGVVRPAAAHLTRKAATKAFFSVAPSVAGFLSSARSGSALMSGV